MSGVVRIGSREVGSGRPCFLIAEAGVNHNGDPELAHLLIDRAADCSVDAIKFQTFDPDTLAAPDSLSAPYQQRHGNPNQHAMLAGLTLPASAWAEIAEHAAERGILFLSTPFDPSSASMLVNLGVPALKVPSGELGNLGLIRDFADQGLPVIISTGMGTLDEVASAMEAASSAPGVALLHCVSAYPAPIAESNLRSMRTMGDAFQVPVGWSDHTLGATTAIAAVALGATLVEKHLTLDRTLPGPDHAASADPAQLSDLVSAIRDTEAALGDGNKRPMPSEEENRFYVRRTLHAAHDLEEGHILRPEDLLVLRPADGLPPTADVIDRRLIRPLLAGSPLTDEDLA